MATRVNKQILADNVLVIDEDGNNLGVMDTYAAIMKAQGDQKDLIEINPSSTPPVCKIIELGKFNYEQKKNQKHVKTPDLKEFQFNINIDPHDLKVKATQMSKLIDKKHPIRVVIKFHGREITKKDQGYKIVDDLKVLLPTAVFDVVKAEEKTLTTMVRHK